MFSYIQVPKINQPAFFALIILPLLLVTLACIYINRIGFGLQEFLLITISYYVCNITVGIGFHRLWSHGCYKTNKIVELLLIFLSAGTLQGPVLAWVSDHHRHHTYTDDEQDPHSPLKYKNKIQGFLWSHIGWMIFNTKENKKITEVVLKKHGANKLIMWQFKYYLYLAIGMNVIFPLAVGYLIEPSLCGAISGIIFIGIGRSLQQHATFFINSLCHFFGSRKYSTNTSGDIWWLAPLLLGENWHNYHHAFPMDYRNGFKWYQFDVHKWIIYLMSRLGLAWDLNRTSDVRIQAKMEEKSKFIVTQAQNQWGEVKTKVEKLKEMISVTINIIENSSNNVKANIDQQFKSIQEKLNYISEQAQLFIQLPEKSTENILNEARKQIRKFENSIIKYSNKFILQ
jgi:stearoyl-CoA desaturase (delta-9 desaturase)